MSSLFYDTLICAYFLKLSHVLSEYHIFQAEDLQDFSVDEVVPESSSETVALVLRSREMKAFFAT